MPGLADGIIAFPTIGIHNDGLIAAFVDLPDQLLNIFRRRAVDPNGLDAVPFLQLSSALCNGRALANLLPIFAAKANPSASTRNFLHALRQRLGFFQAWNSLAGKNLRTGIP